MKELVVGIGKMEYIKLAFLLGLFLLNVDVMKQINWEPFKTQVLTFLYIIVFQLIFA